MNEALAILATSLPLLVGAAFGLLLGNWSVDQPVALDKNKKVGWCILYLASASVISYLLFGYGLVGLYYLEVHIPFSVLMVLLSSLLLILLALSLRSRYQISLCGFSAVLGYSVMIVAAVWWLLQAWPKTPLFSWDSITHWAYNASQLTDWQLALDSPDFTSQFVRHPPAVVGVLAWASVIRAECGVDTSHLIWIVVGAMQSAITVAYLAICGAPVLLLMIAGAVSWFIPLIENHSLLFGYSEIWQSCASIASTAICALGIKFRLNRVISIGVLFSFALLITKNTGFIPLFAVLLALLMELALRAHLARLLLCIGAAVTVACVIFGFSVDLPLAGKIAWEPNFSGVGRFFAAGTMLWVEVHPVSEVLKNLHQALVLNSSFSVLAVALLVSLVLCWVGQIAARFNGERWIEVLDESLGFILSVILIITALIICGQFFTTYIFETSTPTKDTGGSRLLLPLAPVLVLFLFSIGQRIGLSPQAANFIQLPKRVH